MGSDDERYLPQPPRRSVLARIVAVVALAATVVILYLVISASLGSGDDATDRDARPERSQAKNGPETPKEYVVQEGDSISVIADKYGISVERIERLNPDVDPNTLATGVVIKLQK